MRCSVWPSGQFDKVWPQSHRESEVPRVPRFNDMRMGLPRERTVHGGWCRGSGSRLAYPPSPLACAFVCFSVSVRARDDPFFIDKHRIDPA